MSRVATVIGAAGNNCSPGIDAAPGLASGLVDRRSIGFVKGKFMIVRRRTWMYRLAGQLLAQSISFDRPVTASKVRSALRLSVGLPVELWGCSSSDVLLR